MPLYCSSLCANMAQTLKLGKRNENFICGHAQTKDSCFMSQHHKSTNTLPTHIASVSKSDQSFSSPVIEEDRKLLGLVSEPEEYCRELDVAVRAVQMSCFICQKLQDTWISNSQINHPYSPLTVAGESSYLICVISSTFFFSLLNNLC